MRVFNRNSVGFAQVQNLLDVDQFLQLEVSCYFSHNLILLREYPQGFDEFRQVGNMPIVPDARLISDHQHEALCDT